MKTFEDIMKEMARRIVRELLLQYDDAFEELSRLTRACVVFYSCNEPIEDIELFGDIKDFYEYVKKDNSLYFDNYDDAIAFLKSLSLPIAECINIVIEHKYKPDEINTISLANVLAEYKAGECFRTSLPNSKENLAFLVVKILINEFV